VGFPAPSNLDTLSPINLRQQGVIAGVQAGYNWQMNNFLFGIEADANWLDGTSNRHLIYPGPSPAAGDFIDNSVNSRFLATIRPRLGVTMDHLLLYVTGGVAFGSVRNTDTFCIQGCPPGPAFIGTLSTTTTRTGWTAGAGLEYALTANWSVKAEYSMSISVRMTQRSKLRSSRRVRCHGPS
jgi:outer membrane immunogenic protein